MKKKFTKLQVVSKMSMPVISALFIMALTNHAAAFAGSPAGSDVKVKTSRPLSSNKPMRATKVSGTIKDPKGEPLIGVNIIIKNTSTGTTTDARGHYSLNIPNDNAILVISYIGYKTQEIAVNGRTTIDVVMEEGDKALNEVVVVAYGTQKKLSSTAALSSVKGDDLAAAPVANISNSIAGRVSGVSMRPNGGQPGYDNPDIHIRGIATTGNNSPLIVVDGVIRNNINEIDPEAIANVTVLKDAAAVAPYGLGGANGVILITTKHGQTGAPTLTLTSFYGYQSPTYVPKPLNAQDYMRLKNEAYLNEAGNPSTLPYATDLIANYANLNAQDPDKYPNSNPIAVIPKKNAPITQSNIQINGGTKDVKYFAGMGILDQKGLFDPVSYRRYSYNMNLDVNATSTTLVTASISGAFENTNSIDAGIGTNQLYRGLLKFLPIANLTYTNGLWGESAGNTPVGILKAGYYRKNQNVLLSTIGIEQKLPVKGLSIKATFSYDPYNYTEKGWHKPYYYYTQNTSTTPYTYTQAISTAEAITTPYTSLYQNYYQNNSFTYQAYLNYHRNFGKNDITGLLVAEEKNNSQLNFGASRNNFAIDVDELSLGSSNKNDFNNSGGSSTGSQIGYVYRVNYGYNSKYLLEASGRYDGHYYFAPGKRWAFFPAFSAGWVVSSEKFMANITSIDYLKLRASWGKSGNLAGSAFQYLSGYNLYGNSYAFGNGSLVQGSYQPQEANPNITWEVSTKTDAGFEIGLWQDLLRVEADYFWETRSGMLLPPAITVPVEYGLSLAQENAGIMKNHGFDVNINTNYKLNKDLRLGLSGNFSYAKNKMVQVFESSVTRNNPNRSRTGRALNTMFGYHALGLFTTADDKNHDGVINAADGYNVTQFGTLHPGDIKYADISGPNGVPDGKIDSYDETVIGYPQYPRITYGFTPTIAWKGIDLSLFFQGSALESFNITGFQTVPFQSNNSNTAYEYYNNRWTPDHQDAKYPRANQSPAANNTQTSDFWIVNNGYLRLKTALLGYTFPSKMTQKWGIRKLRIYGSGQNVFTISKLNFMDPEVGYSSGETAYPNQKIFTFGLNATF